MTAAYFLKLFTGKNLALGGSYKTDSFPGHNSFHGDVSAIIIQNLPMWAEFFRAPDVNIALMDEWEGKIEALAQTGGILCINAMPKGQYDTYFLKIDNCKFKQMVKPGDTMLLKMELTSPIRRGICEMRGTVYVGGKVATEADLVAQVIKRAE